MLDLALYRLTYRMFRGQVAGELFTRYCYASNEQEALHLAEGLQLLDQERASLTVVPMAAPVPFCGGHLSLVSRVPFQTGYLPEHVVRGPYLI